MKQRFSVYENDPNLQSCWVLFLKYGHFKEEITNILETEADQKKSYVGLKDIQAYIFFIF